MIHWELIIPINKQKYVLNGLNGKMERTEERVTEFEDRSIKIIQTKWQRKNKQTKLKISVWDLWDNYKRTNISVNRVSEEENE